MTAITASAHYVFLDVIEFTRGRSVEAQTDIVGVLNRVVSAALTELGLPAEQLILLPTGDGLCIAMLAPAPFDCHLSVALSIVAAIDGHNQSCDDPKRQFTARIGINQNVDNLVEDINGRRNIAGAGINMAQRVMSLGDGNQVLVSQSVFEVLQARERYMGSFRRLSGRDKHGNAFPVYQYVQASPGLNCETPLTFQVAKKAPPPLTEQIALYLAHAIRLEAVFLSSDFRHRASAMIVLLHYLSSDSAKRLASTPFDRHFYDTHAAPEAAEQLSYYARQDISILVDFSGLICSQYLEPYRDCFTFGAYEPTWVAVSPNGRSRLETEQKGIAELLAKGQLP